MRGAHFHPQTQGKIQRWQQTPSNRVLPETYFMPGNLEQAIDAFVEHYNHERCHESHKNVSPADANFGRAPANIKRQTLEYRRMQHSKLAA